jgi:sulfatase modifying factor 1
VSLRVFVVLAGAFVELACRGQSAAELPPTGQILLYVSTDAPLPPAPGERLGPNEPPALFDRLRVDIFAPGTSQPCPGCSREFELDRIRVRDGEASVGVVPPPGVSGYVARARLYRAISVKQGEPPPLSTIDVYAALPPVEREGITKTTLVLHVDDVGQPRGSMAMPTDAQPGEPDVSLPGSWPKAQRVPCSGLAAPGEACVPGGAFWMGHPFCGVDFYGADVSASRLVVVSPFYVGLHEVTVADYRASGLATRMAGSSADPSIGPPEGPPDPLVKDPLTPNDLSFFCDYSDQPFSSQTSRENLALNCISWSAASEFCKAQGKTLPSEAELEYMMSGLRSDLYVWGQDQAGCGDSVWGRGGVGVYYGNPDDCRPDNGLGSSFVTFVGQPSALAPGHGSRDRLTLAEGEVLDLSGNLREWTRDLWNRSTEPCWNNKLLLTNPECATKSDIDGETHTLKGGSWAHEPGTACTRIDGPPSDGNPTTGFRCIRSAR